MYQRQKYYSMVLLFVLSVAMPLIGTSSQTKLKKSLTSNDELRVIEKGEKISWLTCVGKGNGIDWKKDGFFIARNKTLNSQYYLISCASQNDIGNYSCHNRSKMEPPLKTFTVEVAHSNNVYPCGMPNQQALVELSQICHGYKQSDYPCCEDFAPPPRYVNVYKTFNQSDSKCDLFKSGRLEKPWRIRIEWQLPYYGSKNIWGWQIRLTGKNGDPNYQHCAQINSKDKMLSWRIPPSVQLLYGATYVVVVQSLPSQYGDKSYVSNAISKTFTTPTMKDSCRKLGRECKWEFCWPVKNITVINQNTASVEVSWVPSQYYKSAVAYQLLYWSSGNCDGVKEITTNKTRITITKALLTNCTRYYVKIRPIFKHRLNGFFAKSVLLYINANKTESIESHLQKVLISCTVAVCVVLGALVLFFIRKCNQSSNSKAENEEEPLQVEADSEDKITEVLIVHANHCNLCNHVTHSIAYVLNETGYIKCSLDICSDNEIRKDGLFWYGEKLKSCDKVLIICTKEGQKILEAKEQLNYLDQSANVFKFNLKIIMARIINHDYSHKVVPVYYDYSNHEDIPFFLSDRRSYALPAEFQELILGLINFNSRPNNADIQYNITETIDMTRMVSKVKTTMANMIKDHYNNNTTTSTTSTTAPTTTIRRV